MAKKDEEKAIAVVDDLAGMVTTQRPSEGDSDGPPSHIGRDDVSMPRLALAQAEYLAFERGMQVLVVLADATVREHRRAGSVVPGAAKHGQLEGAVK